MDSMADTALTYYLNEVKEEYRKPQAEQNANWIAKCEAEIIRLTPVPPIQPTGKFFSLFAAIRIVSIFHSLYLSQLMILS